MLQSRFVKARDGIAVRRGKGDVKSGPGYRDVARA